MADDPKAKRSPYTTDQQIPGAFEGETVTRRRLMTGGAQVFGGVAAAAFGLPALAFALGPVFERPPATWQAVGSTTDFPDDIYVPRVIQIVSGIGEAGKSTVFMRKRNPEIDTEPADQYNQFIAISTRCMHLGCPVRFIEAAQRFVCPCHGGVYGFRGEVDGGPPVRPLDRFYTRIGDSPNGKVVEIGPRYSVNSSFERYAPRDPGEPLDGIGQYLYPPRFSTPEL